MGTNTELVAGVMGALRAGDLDSIGDRVADDFVWHIPGTCAISGDAIGVRGWAEKLARLVGAGLRPEVISMMESESHVAALQHNTADAGGARLDQQVVNVFTVADGRITRLDTFFSDQPAAESFWNAALD